VRRLQSFLASLALAWLLIAGRPGVAGEGDQAASFRDQVEPILARRCLSCHSHAAGQMEGNLALDWKSGWATGGDRGPAILPGSPDESLLIQAVRHADADLKMPDDKLPDAEIAILEAWVRDGAVDPRVAEPAATAAPGDWWSLRPLVSPSPPAGSAPVPQNPIDSFLDERLVKEGLVPVPEADRRSFIRRVSIDLHGLPPTPEEAAAFIADTAPGAHERLVDRLLASPRFGERMARHWFDAIHFADSHGFEHDVFRPNAWPYRDWVIKAFNDDLPWPTFVRAQLAADVFFPDDPPTFPALGYLGAGTYDHSAAATAPRSFENLDRDDMVTQVMSSLASTTANCARCHAHKFDPVSQEDYYALQAVFAGIGKGEIDWDSDSLVAAARKRWRRVAREALSAPETLLDDPENPAIVAAWESASQTRAVWTTLPLATFTSAFGTELARLDDGSILSGGTPPEKEVITVTLRGPHAPITALRLDLLTDDSLPMKGPGRAHNGNLHLSEFDARVFRAGGAPAAVNIARSSADFNQESWTIEHALDGNPATAWGIHPEEGKPHHAVFVLAAPLVLGPDDTLAISLRQIHGGAHVIGRFRLSATSGDPDAAIALPAAAEEALAIPAATRTRAQQASIAAAILTPLAQAELTKLPPPNKLYAAATTAVNERGTIVFPAPREIHVLKRGDLDQPRGLVGPGALSAIVGLPSRFEFPPGTPESARRAALADWFVDEHNPLTWRSIANRVWQWHFGRGLCDTPGDFGRMGGLPSHPELLDWLAAEIRRTGSLKAIHRLICTSLAYRRASLCPPELFRADPDNRLLARMSPHRLDAESFYDGVLLASGRLDDTRGGPAVAHFSQRPGAQLTPILDYDAFDWDSPGATRRSIYRVVWRGIPDPLFDALDFPDLGLLSPTRGFSASPLQALVLANNRFVLHHARHLARRAESAAPDPAADPLQAKIGRMVQWTWQREPTSEETAELAALASRHGLEAVARALFNGDEFLFVD
jgi:mono/diheme cytochrome c family protein